MAELVQFIPTSYTGAVNAGAATAYLATTDRESRQDMSRQLGIGEFEPTILDSVIVAAKLAACDEAIQENYRPLDD